MVKLRKQRRKKVYKHNVNRKRMRNKINSVGNIGCKEIKDAWDEKKSIQANLDEMGLSYDPNYTIKIPNKKNEITQKLRAESKETEDQEETLEKNVRKKTFVAKALEADARAPRVKRFQLPKSQVEWITYLLKKYKNDYKAMARDNKNYYQETWRQLRQKIRTFKKVPGQYKKFLEENGVQECDFNSEESDGEL